MKKMDKKQKILLIGAGAISGIVNGMFGAGSGLLLVPMLKKITKLETKKVHSTTLACVLFMCVSSAIVFILKGKVDYDIFGWCLIGSLLGGVVGTMLLKHIKNNVIEIIFSIILIAAGVVMIVI